MPRPSLIVDDSLPVHPTFMALFQGDACGVEFAKAGHQGLLQSVGLLQNEHGRLRSKHRVPPLGPRDGLIIDDYFSLSVEDSSYVPGSPCKSLSWLHTAKKAYASEGVLGSDAKDVLGERLLKVAGAELDSSSATVRDGATLAASPAAKRLALAAASLRAAVAPVISEELASMLAGSWVSCLLFRRCLMSCLDGLFGLGRLSASQAKGASGAPGSPLKHLPRKVAAELQLLAVLSPVAVSNLSAEPPEEVFASDSSRSKGAFCSVPVTPELGMDLWSCADFKGSHVLLAPRISPGQAAHAPFGAEASQDEDFAGQTREPDLSLCLKPLRAALTA